MCGIAAICKGPDLQCSGTTLHRMRDEISHRGPDDFSTVLLSASGEVMPEIASEWQVGLANRRLSIIDISHSGHQPMHYSNDFWITYNGEVYNYLELKRELVGLGYRFESATDTEVILAAYAEWGTDCFRRLRGMWGLALFDKRRHELIICRDRLGIKPLYQWQGNGLLAFVSEIKQLKYAPGFNPSIAVDPASEYLLSGYENPAVTLFKEVTPVPPGTFTRIDVRRVRVVEQYSYWNPEAIRPTIKDSGEAAGAFAATFEESIRLHMRADVPVGCALSGGLDSSSIAAVMNRIKGPNVALHSFTITFPGFRQDERPYVDFVTERFAMAAHYCTPDPLAFDAELDRFVWVHDEPIGTLSVYAAYCVARLTRQCGVPVTLNGQGADEVLGGYWPSYMLYLRDLFRGRRLGRLALHVGGALLPGGNPELLAQMPFQFRRYRMRRSVAVRSLSSRTPGTAFEHAMSVDTSGRRLHEMRALFLPRLLKWEDRNSMAFSVEGRYPFLDHQLIELCLSFSPDILYRRGWTKWVLRQSLQGCLPHQTVARKTKWGFEAPQSQWMRNTLRPHIERWLQADQLLWSIVRRADVIRLATEVWGATHHERDQELFRLFMFYKWAEGWDAVL